MRPNPKIKPKLIVVTGLPASGKTWLATEISRALSLPLLTKDELKVEMLQTLGKKDRAWDVQVGTAAVHVQIKVAGHLLAKNVALILESNFKEKFDAPLLRELVERSGCDSLQIVCGAEGKVLIERFGKRESSSQRELLYHPSGVEEFGPILEMGFQEPLQLPGAVIRVDTTDFAKVGVSRIIDSVNAFLER